MFERYTCTKENPWSKEKGRYAEHPDSVHLYDDEHDNGVCDVLECPNCGLKFHVELPD